MFTYKEQRQMLDPVRLREGESKRIDCPFCGGRKTMSLSRRDGQRMWHCFKASCSISGASKAERTVESLRASLNASERDREPSPPRSLIPDRLAAVERHEVAAEYLKQNGCWEAYQSGLVEIRYDPADRRVLFFMPDGQGAVGRSLRGAKPKWKAYGDTSGILRVGSGDVGVVVEDAASAASISRLPFCSGCALLGTNVSVEKRQQLMSLQRLVIALDKDASKKAVGLQQYFEGRIPTTVLLLEEDLKYLSVADLEGLKL